MPLSRRRFALTGCALLTSACGGASPAVNASQTSDARFSALRAEIQQSVHAGDAPSIALGVAEAGDIVWNEGFGWADQAKRISAGPHTRYAVASIAKPITATGVMQMVERGLLDLDVPANTYLDDDAHLVSRGGDSGAATVRHLLQHRAGLPTHGRYFYTGDGLSPPPIQETIRNYGIVVHPPGERYVYSNLGYGVLAYITARAAGRAYDDHMRESLFEPLGMGAASIEIASTLSAEAATLYDGDGKAIPYYVFDEWGSGRVSASVNDLLRFGMFHLKERQMLHAQVLGEPLIDQMLTDRISTGLAGAPFGPEWFYALGWNGREATAHNPFWFGHNGRMSGVSSELRLFPEQGIAVVVLSNGRQSLTQNLVDRIIDILIPGHAAMRANDPLNRPWPPRPPFEAGALEGCWIGEVVTPQGPVPVRLSLTHGDDARLTVGNQPPAPLTTARLRDGRFTADCEGAILPSEDTLRHPHALQLDLTSRQERLEGTLTARGPAERVRFHLPFWMSLRRETT